MKQYCEPHNYNPPSLCPNCRIKRKRALKARAKAGWVTRRDNQNAAEKARFEQQYEAYRQQGWKS
jgi:hypothetical protein